MLIVRGTWNIAPVATARCRIVVFVVLDADLYTLFRYSYGICRLAGVRSLVVGRNGEYLVNGA